MGGALKLDPGTLAIVTAKSSNRKLGPVAATYAAQTSCPTDCVFFGSGCYAEGGPMGAFVTRPLNKAAREIPHTPEDVARAEAEKIDALDVVPGRALRLHVVGDCKTDESARILSAASERYMERGGGKVWTYTHAWRTVDRVSWGRVSVLASCETPMDILLAETRGYATSIVVEEFEDEKAYWLWEHEPPTVPVKIIPCPAQTKGVHCDTCGLCMNDERLRLEGLTIAFAVHGPVGTAKAAKAALS